MEFPTLHETSVQVVKNFPENLVFAQFRVPRRGSVYQTHNTENVYKFYGNYPFHRLKDSALIVTNQRIVKQNSAGNTVKSHVLQT